MMPWETAPANPFRFRGNIIPYKNQRTVYKWGGFYVDNRGRSGRPRPLNPGPCPFCTLAFNSRPDPLESRVTFNDETYILINNHNPIVENQLLFFPLPTSNNLRFLEHRVDLNATDVRLVIELVTNGFKNLKCSRYKKHEMVMKLIEAKDSVYKNPWIAYVNAFPGAGRSVTHLHINCLPAAYAPVLDVDPQPWQVCQDQATGTIISRLADINFYGLILEAKTSDALAKTIARLHQELNLWEIPYNLIAYPLGTDETAKGIIRVAIIPRDQEYCEAADQRIAGLEFVTGILIPGVNRVSFMDTIQRDLAFRQATLKKGQRLRFERRLRSIFGMPPPGKAVYPVPVDKAKTGKQGPEKYGAKASKYKPCVRINKTFNERSQTKIWTWQEDYPKPDFDKLRMESNVLVRITRASICQSDRRVLMGNKAKGPSKFTDLKKSGKDKDKEKIYVLGHEAGGYVVDPGPWGEELTAGQKAVILPHWTCGQSDCEYCPRYKQNLCERMLHLGFELNGNMAELMSFPYQCVMPVPNNFPDDALPLVEPLACVIRALFRIKDKLSALSGNSYMSDSSANSFTVYGSGPMGCLAARAVKRFWPPIRVTMVEPINERREMLQESHIADRVVEEMPDKQKSFISFVASSKLRASFDAIKNTDFGGTVVLFSGINEDDLKADRKQRHTLGANFERIHRQEKSVVESDPAKGTSHHLIGSSGYNFDDAARSVHELSRHYAHYANLQNVVINGLSSTEAIYCKPQRAGSNHIHEHECKDQSITTFPKGVKAVEALLSPKGVYDKVYGTAIAQMIKVLIRL